MPRPDLSPLLTQITGSTRIYTQPGGVVHQFEVDLLKAYVLADIVDSSPSSITDNGDGTYTHDDGTGVEVTINTNALTSAIIDSGLYFDSAEVENALQEIGQWNEDVHQLIGVTVGDVNLGTFAGTIISDNASVKQALAELEAEVEGATSYSFVIKDDANNTRTIGNGHTVLYEQKDSVMSVVVGAIDATNSKVSIGLNLVGLSGGEVLQYNDGTGEAEWSLASLNIDNGNGIVIGAGNEIALGGGFSSNVTIDISTFNLGLQGSGRLIVGATGAGSYMGKSVVVNGDFQAVSVGYGLILSAASGERFRFTTNNNGDLISTSLGFSS